MDFVSRRWWYLLFSGLVILAGIISMTIPPAFRVGIEFTGGATLMATFQEPTSQEAMRVEMTSLGHQDASIQRSGDRSFFIRTRELAEAQRDPQTGLVVKPSERETIQKALEERFGKIEGFEFASVSPVVAGETVRNAILAVALASVFILLYIWWAFRRMPHSFRLGVAAVVALMHDVMVTLGLISILGKFIHVEVNAMFITGVLTVVGYSVHDTIVVFDRVRENSLRGVARELETTINVSIMETMGRSLGTSLTTLFAIVALLLFGGATIRSFLLTLLIGIITGTYSSIFVASQLLVVWERREWLGPLARLLRRKAEPAQVP